MEEDKKDIVQKEFEAYPDVAADIINALLYEGQRTVEERNLLPAPTETVYQGEKRLRNQYEDLAKYELSSDMLNMIYLIANQSDVDHRMLLRKASYTGAVYGDQYKGKIQGICPVAELVLYWGKARWSSVRSMRERFSSDMRIIVDYLAEGDSYSSDRPVRHKEALVKMIRVLSGDDNVEDTAEILKETGIREEDEITMCELFDQYTRKGIQQGLQQGLVQGIQQGIKAAIAMCKKLNVTFEVAAEQIKEQFNLSDAEVQDNMKLYW